MNKKLLVELPVVDSIKTGENIERILNDNGVSRYRLSEVLGISQAAIAKWVNGESVPTIDNVIKLMSMFNVQFEDILAY